MAPGSSGLLKRKIEAGSSKALLEKAGGLGMFFEIGEGVVSSGGQVHGTPWALRRLSSVSPE